MKMQNNKALHTCVESGHNIIIVCDVWSKTVEKEYQALIDRIASLGHVSQNFADILGVFRDVVNYGSNLVPRCFVSSKRELTDAIVLGVLLRQSIAMFDAIEILLSNAAVYPCHLQIRALFEASLYLEWMLQKDTETRAKYYYVANVRQERIWAMRTQSGDPENLSYGKIMAGFGDLFQEITDQIADRGKEYLQEINRILAQASFADIDMSIERFRKKSRKPYDPPWYAPLGPKSVRQIAVDLNRLHEYETIYSPSSEVMHSTSHKAHVKFSQGRIHFTPIRHLAGIDNVVKSSMATMVKIYTDVLRHYREDELPNFGKKYFEDWREAFMGIRAVEYKNNPEDTSVI
jgi:hypothetical protein